MIDRKGQDVVGNASHNQVILVSSRMLQKVTGIHINTLEGRILVVRMPEIPLKLIDIDRIPAPRKTRQEWIDLLQKIPTGKALVIDEKETKTTAGNVKAMVKRIVDEKEVIGTFRVVQRTVAGRATIYIMNESVTKKVSGGEQTERATRLTG